MGASGHTQMCHSLCFNDMLPRVMIYTEHRVWWSKHIPPFLPQIRTQNRICISKKEEDTSFLKVMMHDLPLFVWCQGNWKFLLGSAAPSSLQHVLCPFRPPLVGAIDRSCSGPALWEWWGNPANSWQDICSNSRWYLVLYMLKGKPIPVTGCGGPWGYETSRLPHFPRQSAQMAVRLLAIHVCHPLFPGRFVVLISVRGWVDSRAIVGLEGLGHLKNLTISSGIEPMTFLLVAYASTNYAAICPFL
jgi:hypothetical protein